MADRGDASRTDGQMDRWTAGQVSLGEVRDVEVILDRQLRMRFNALLDRERCTEPYLNPLQIH